MIFEQISFIDFMMIPHSFSNPLIVHRYNLTHLIKVNSKNIITNQVIKLKYIFNQNYIFGSIKGYI